MSKKIFIPISLGLSLLLLNSCRQYQKAETSSDLISPASASIPETTLKETLASTKIPADSTGISDKSSNSSGSSQELPSPVKTQIKNFTEARASIQYPVLSGIKDNEKLNKINTLIEDNAKSIISTTGIDSTSDILDIKANIISSDRKRISICYTGTLQKADESNKVYILYSNTVDLESGENLALKDFADPYTIAGYILSNDVEVVSLNKNAYDYFMKNRNNTSIEEYTELLSEADFPLKNEDGVKVFPKSFSYVKNGDIYVSIPTECSAGDYVLIKFSPNSK